MPPELLICGPAGTGKTWGILDVLHCLCRDNPGLRVLMARATRAALTESVLVTYEQEILPLDGMEAVAAGVKRRVRQGYRYPNGSEMVLGGLDDSNRILSTAWDIVYVNECIEAEEGVWETILSRMSRPGRSSRFGYLIGDTNPGDPSHWLRGRVDGAKTLAEWSVPHQANPAMYDGRAWTEAGARYLAALARLTGSRRKRLKDGLWAAGEGQWFSAFDVDRHVSPAAAYDPRWPVHLAVDCGVHTGAVWFQVRGEAGAETVSCFGDFYSYDVAAHENARQILARTAALCGGRFDVGRMDPAGNSAAGFGGTTLASEYQRAGLKLTPWPKFPGCVAAGLALVESFAAAPESPRLLVHPDCTALINALSNYKRKKRGGQYVDEPEDPCHPYEDLVDALRSGLLDKFPEGRKPAPAFPRVNARRVF